MAHKTQSSVPSEGNDLDKVIDEVDPRVQIELERLNTATDDINKLEVDLDEARAAFRQLLCESTIRIDCLAKKLGSCVEKARPYYEARIKAKEALQETQHAAVRFERANSAHAAAKEMVYLAEEGLSTEGRTFDNAWQEMLNHATMRVNESERERTSSEVEHRRTSQSYHRAETRVQQLQKELKRGIAKSSMNARRSLLQINSIAYRHQLLLLPYFELKAQFNQLLEEQKRRVKSLEQQVGHAKSSYAEALRNLEQISDEIHRTRKYENLDGEGGDPLGARGPGVGAESPLPLTAGSVDGTYMEPPSRKISPPGLSSSSLPDADMWSDSTGTGPPDSDSEEFLRLPEKLGPTASPVLSKDDTDSVASQVSEYLGLSNLGGNRSAEETDASQPMAELAIHSQNTLQSSSMSPRHIASRAGMKVMETSFVDKRTSQQVVRKLDFESSVDSRTSKIHFVQSNNNCSPDESNSSDIVSDDSPLVSRQDSKDQIWTEISLVDSPEETSQTFAKMGPNARNIDRDHIHYSTLTEESNIKERPPEKSDGLSFSSVIRNPFLPSTSVDKTFLPQSPLLSRARSLGGRSEGKTSQSASPAKHPSDSSAKTGDASPVTSKVGESLKNTKPPVIGLFKAGSANKSASQSPTNMASKTKLDSSLSGWISRSAASDSSANNSGMNRRQSLDTLLWGGPTTERVKELLSHGMMMLNISSLTERRASEPQSGPDKPEDGSASAVPSSEEATFSSKESKGSSLMLTKKVPSPLEKSLNYLNAEDDSTSDSESLASVEMLTDEQISSLMLDQEIQDACEEVLGTPISEISPLIQDLKQREQQREEDTPVSQIKV